MKLIKICSKIRQNIKMEIKKKKRQFIFMRKNVNLMMMYIFREAIDQILLLLIGALVGKHSPSQETKY